ncbi:GlxA family transcriptional regulator [Ralstonia pickettii]|nr:AraC family transcriptional regulator [Ralstonia pickettii]
MSTEPDSSHSIAAEFLGEPRKVVLLATPASLPLEISGPADVFSMVADKLREAGRSRSRPYAVELISATRQLDILPRNSVHMVASRSYAEVNEAIDTLLVVGGMEVWNGREEPGVLEWLRAQAGSTRRLGSICTGAFLLAEAGLLDERRVTTHWFFCERLASDYPRLTVDPEPIYIRDEHICTSAGVSAGIDLALGLVEEDLGADIAMRVARALVLYLRRSDAQSQFSAPLAVQASGRSKFRELPFWILENLHRRLEIPELADRMSMTPRTFARRFKAEFGMPPARFVTDLRLQMATSLLRDSDKSREAIASKCGFGSVDAMERAMARQSS